MTSTVFMIDSNNCLTELSQTDYNSEDLFQRLLADHPSLLGSASGSSGRLLLVRAKRLFLQRMTAWAVGPWTTSFSMVTVPPFLWK